MKIIRWIVILSILCVLVYFSAQVALQKYLEGQLKQFFHADTVRIKHFKLVPPLNASAKILKVSSDSIQADIPEVSLYLRGPGFLKRSCSSISIRNSRVRMKKDFAEVFSFSTRDSEGSSGEPSALFFPLNLSLENINLSLETPVKKIDFHGSLRLEFNGKGDVNLGPVNVYGLSASLRDKFSMENLSMAENNIFTVDKVQAGNVQIKQIMGEVVQKGNTFYLEGIKTYFLGDQFYSKAEILVDIKDKRVDAQATFSAIDMGRLLDGLLKEKKVLFRGIFAGKMKYAFFIDRDEHFLDVDLNSSSGHIKMSEQTLSDLKARMQQESYKLLIESLKDYEYNKSEVLAKSEGSDLALTVNMDSEQGKRNFFIVFHDVLRR